MKYDVHAEWPPGTVRRKSNQTTLSLGNIYAARAACRLLKAEGHDGKCKKFPKRVWIEYKQRGEVITEEM
jgi:hypothetical protein